MQQGFGLESFHDVSPAADVNRLNPDLRSRDGRFPRWGDSHGFRGTTVITVSPVTRESLPIRVDAPAADPSCGGANPRARNGVRVAAGGEGRCAAVLAQRRERLQVRADSCGPQKDALQRLRRAST